MKKNNNLLLNDFVTIFKLANLQNKNFYITQISVLIYNDYKINIHIFV